jgi:hypothetical protein
MAIDESGDGEEQVCREAPGQQGNTGDCAPSGGAVHVCMRFPALQGP